MARGFEPVDQSCPRSGESQASRWVPAASRQRLQSTTFEPVLVSPHGPHITAEGAADIVLVGPALFHEVDHSVRLGHPIPDDVLRKDSAGHEDQAVIVLGPDQAAVIDDNGAWRRRQRWEKVVGSGRFRHGGERYPWR